MARKLASFYQTAKNTGRVPRNPFRPTDWTTEIPAQIAEHRQNTIQGNGLPGHFTYRVNPKDPLFQVLLSGDQDLACTVLRVRSVYTGGPRGYPQQSLDRRNWGVELAPGVYKSITVSGVSQTCFLAPISGGKASVFGGSYLDESVSSGVR
jgi:hypothetical protein